jgi:dephospho-CoA kinase
MGKSTAAAMLRGMGLRVHDADAAVHRFLTQGGSAVSAVEAAFPGVSRGGGIDRKALGARVFGNPEALRRLESILHPLVRRDARDFLWRESRRGASVAVLDIPLMFETGGEALCDAVIVVTAPHFVQEARVLSRSDMTPERLEQVRGQQMPEVEKRRRADFVIPTGAHRSQTLHRLRAAVRLIESGGIQRHGLPAWPLRRFRPTPRAKVMRRRPGIVPPASSLPR